MVFLVKKTVIFFDEENYLVYIGAFLFKCKGNKYLKQKEYMKELVKQYWNVYHKTPNSLKDADKIQIMENVFGINNIDIV